MRPVAGRSVEGREQEVKVDRQRVHRHDLAGRGADQLTERRGEALVEVHPRVRPAMVLSLIHI